MHHARRLTPQDAEAYVALRREMLLDAPWAFLASPGSDRASDPARVRETLAHPDRAIVGVVELPSPPMSAEILLAVAGVTREEPEKRRHLAVVWGVYVTPSARGRDLGRAVMTAVIDAARTIPGVVGLRLSASVRSTAAIHLYQSLGFEIWGREPDAVRTVGQSYDEVHMQLAL